MRVSPVLVVAFVVGCGQSSGTADTTGMTGMTGTSAGPGTTGSPTTGGGSLTGGPTSGALSEATGPAATTTDATTGGPQQDLVTVGHTREFRAVWVATVSNINFPGSPGVDPDGQKAELAAMFDTIAATGFNAVVFQVRPESDALYASAIEPWSRYLTGTQGQDPGYDPLAYATEQAHARGLELHAWFNPYRAKASKGSATATNHISQLYPEYAYSYDPAVWMDPGAPPVQDQLVAVITDVVTRYDVDGIHFDDYFYPYPNGEDFPDNSTWSAYKDGGGALTRGDWRRDNVNKMVERVNQAVVDVDPAVRFGISPFGIYRPGMPPGIEGLDQYAEIYSDPVLWMQSGWLDYLAPQLYWPSTQTKQAYGKLIAWWAGTSAGGRHIFAGNYLSKLGSAEAWSVDEFRTQVTLSRAQADAGSRGNIFFHVGPILANQDGVADVLAAEFYATPALTPAIAAQVGVVVQPPVVEVVGTSAMLSHANVDSLRAWVVYSQEGEGWAIQSIVPVAQTSVALAAGTWAISAAGRHGVESAGVRVFVQ